jgi:hypothetical protein
LAAQLAAGPRQQAFQCLDADVHQGRGVDVREFLVVLQHNGFALALGQCCQGGGQAGAALSGFKLFSGGRRAVGQLKYVVIVHRALFTPAQTIVAQVQRHPVQPGVKARLAATPTGGVAPDTQEGFLGHVTGLVGIPQQPTGQGQQTRELARHHFVDGRRFVVADTCQQLNVGISVFQSGHSRFQRIQCPSRQYQLGPWASQ